jgi:hypothetical protein
MFGCNQIIDFFFVDEIFLYLQKLQKSSEVKSVFGEIHKLHKWFSEVSIRYLLFYDEQSGWFWWFSWRGESELSSWIFPYPVVQVCKNSKIHFVVILLFQFDGCDSRSGSNLSLKQLQIPHRQNSEMNANTTQSPSHPNSKVTRSISATQQKTRRLSQGDTSGKGECRILLWHLGLLIKERFNSDCFSSWDRFDIIIETLE